MSSSESIASDTEYLDHVHKCLKYIPIYKKGAFSCSSHDNSDDENDDDEDVKRILTEHGETKPGDCETMGFSSAYKAAAALLLESPTDSTSAKGLKTKDDYEDWHKVLDEVSTVYPPLGVGRVASRELESRKLSDLTSKFRSTIKVDDDDCGDRHPASSPKTKELRKCLEEALYGQDIEDFMVVQPYCMANKNLDLGKPKMSHKAINASRKKVENWMSKYVEGDETTAVTFYN